MLKLLIAFILFLAFSISVNAGPGCINASRDLIYTNYQNGQQYWRGTPTPSSPGCLFISTGGVCSIGSNGANNGLLGDTTNVQECPIDDYIWLMIPLIGGLGYYTLRKKLINQSFA